ncbi:MAG: phenylalanine--tRNA ligase subunit beta [Tidjanibacter sp.]|nr:phenylalanine--tRNA ligase subunit beta [Tidjanibacter sp.]
MNISYNWLKNYLLSDLKAEEAAVILTDIGLEIEDFEKLEAVKGGLKGVVVGEVLTCEDHPDSDHLHVTTVDVGTGEPLGIVCGAANCRKGLKVMCATVGAELHPIGSTEVFKIKRSKIRGVESLGMLCAEDELGIGSSHDGIMELDENAIPGTPAMEYLKLTDDYRLGIGLTPNRIDAASHYGVARDLAAYLRSQGREAELRLPSVEDFKVDNTSRATQVVVENSEAAPRYAGINISGVKVAPSPQWLQNALRAIGINPKNNVVDVTNYVLHELCQPLHSFDADRIAGNKVVVRTCPEGTPFRTLDGVERKLSEQDLMICDSEKPMCIAGVFGGEHSGVTENTTNVFLESAYFNPVWVRKTAKRHALSTDASFRFERGIDPNITVYALKRAALLIKELAGGEITSEITDIYPAPVAPFAINISYDYIDNLIGKAIGQQTIKDILHSLEIEITGETSEGLSVLVPAYRVDVQRPADLVEEILRIYGYNNVEIPEHVNSTLSYEAKPNRDKLRNMVSDMLSACGFAEVMNNSLSKSSYYENSEVYPSERCVKIMNPLSADLGVMRQTLLYGLMEVVELNVNRKAQSIKIYEFGNTYTYNAERKEEDGLAPYDESFRLSVAISGARTSQSWNSKTEASDFFTLKAVAEKILRRFGMDIYTLRSEPIQNELYAEGLSLKAGNKELLQIATISPKVRKMFDLKGEVYFLDIDFDTLLKYTKKHKVSVKELAKFPAVKRDLALLVDSAVSYAELRQIAFQTEKKLLKDVTLFDVYTGDKLEAGKKSYALGFILQDESKTLDEKTIENTMNKLIDAFAKKAGATIR